MAEFDSVDDRGWIGGQRGVGSLNRSRSTVSPPRLLLMLVLLASCGGGGGAGGEADSAHIELTGKPNKSIDLTLDRKGARYRPPTQSTMGGYTLGYTNDQGQRLTLQGPARPGTYGTSTSPGDALLQMQVNPNRPGYSHDAFADQCKVTVDRAQQNSITGRFTCDFPSLHAEGTFSAAF
jgi:hypothetical protein